MPRFSSSDFENLENGVVIRMLENPSGNLVLTERSLDKDGERNSYDDGREGQQGIVKPIIWVHHGRWRDVPRRIIDEYHSARYYLVALPWHVRKQFKLSDGLTFQQTNCHVLHCVRKEIPCLKFGGKVGPISSFAPRQDHNGNLIRGFYSGYLTRDNEHTDELPRQFEGMFTLDNNDHRNKDVAIYDKNNNQVKQRRLGVLIGQGGCCICMEVKMLQEEEKLRRKQGEYHHNRPIVMENGFYIFDGFFTWQPIKSNLIEPIDFPSSINSPVVCLGEGIHLITSTKQIDPSTGTIYSRIEIAPSSQAQNVCVLNWNVLKNKFFKF